MLANEFFNLIDRIPATHYIRASYIFLSELQRNTIENCFGIEEGFLLLRAERVSGFDLHPRFRRNDVEKPDHCSGHSGLVNGHRQQQVQVMQISG
jgi:hypothetical protein